MYTTEVVKGGSKGLTMKEKEGRFYFAKNQILPV